jgi:hypothetical protein
MRNRLHIVLSVFAMILFLASGVHVTLSKCHSEEQVMELPSCCGEECGDTEDACGGPGLSGDDCCTRAEASFFVPVYGIDKVQVPDPLNDKVPTPNLYISNASYGREVSFSLISSFKAKPPAASINQLGVYRI